MTTNSGRDIEIFTEAIQIPVEERTAFLDQACAGDGRLRQKIEALLRSNERTGGFLEQPAATIGEMRGKAVTGEKPGELVDRYKLLQQIGEGGCGVVFVAEQQTPVLRRVALKLIKPGMDSKSVIARFEAERQALALMDHPNIARVFDAGATKSGRPYFVMELVEGVKITDYCDQHSLPIGARLELFIQVCDAIQHAHQKGIIHRDIKPSNILVTTAPDGKPVPKVIDFGIAKATAGQQLTDKTIFTAHEMLIGTPAYMSPEQAALASTEVDTRTDIYSLGVLLYELLTGATPFNARELLKSGFDEVRRVVREQEPVRPSTRLSTISRADLTEVCQYRHSEPSALIRQFRGDLDWIVMMALEKDRTRRYKTANGLALDVQRFLADETVLARPSSKLYKLQKLVLRNRLVSTTIGTVAVLLVAGVILLSAALAREREAHRQADKDKQKAEQVMRFVVQMADNNENIMSTLRHLADIAQADGKVAESERMRSQALSLFGKPDRSDPLNPDELGSLLALKAGIEARHGQWEQAAADAAQSLDYQPRGSFRYTMVAALYLKIGNRSAYEQFCKKLFLEFHDTDNIFVADQVAKACLFLPASQVDLNEIGRLADTAVTLGVRDEGAMPFFSVCKGLSEYRLGHFAQAAEWVQKAINSPRKDAHPHAYGILALAFWQLGKKDDARAMFAAGEKLAPRVMPASVAEDPGTAWLVWLFARIQLDEAEALVNPPSPAADNSNSQPQAR
ncbi:MAG: serine/threonine-protein kinase [Limisphaerales bacterium]